MLIERLVVYPTTDPFLQRLRERVSQGELIGLAGIELDRKQTGGASPLSSKLVRHGAGYRLSGRKFYSTGSIFADWISTYAALEDGTNASVLLPRDRKGLELVDDWDGMGQRLTGTGTTIFHDVEVAPEEVMRDEELHPQGKFFSSTIAQLFLTTVIAGVTAAIAEDAGEVLGSRERTFYFAPTENAKDDPLLLASIGERHADAFATEAIVLAAARVLDEAATGGQRQRVMIAMAIALKPQLLIADEPTTALDASVREQILSLIDRLRRELNMAVLLISHDLPLVSRWTDRVIIMHHGKAMEALPSPDLFKAGRHPYTRGLIGASIRLDDGKRYDRARLAEVQAVRKPDGEFDFMLKQAVSATTGMLPAAEPALTVRDLVVQYGGTRAVDGVSFTIPKGRTLGLVGESGCGKSSLSRAIMGLVRPTSGEVVLGEDTLSGLSSRAMRPHRRRLQMIFQDPFASLNPRHAVRTILGGVLHANGISSSAERQTRIRETLDQVGLTYNSIHRLPHEFSGGQRQRIAIARAHPAPGTGDLR